MENSHIEWTDHTFNIVEGCQKISPACENCYAERRDKRIHSGAHWGANSTRKQMSESYWAQPLRWNKKAAAVGIRQRVFCSSLADVFENHPDLVAPRERLFYLINDTPHLDWLLLTKRPENITPFLIEFSKGTYGVHWNLKDHLPNVWLGTTVENQKYADLRIPELLKITAKVLFLSVEPMLGAINIAPYIGHSTIQCKCGFHRDETNLWGESCRDCHKTTVRGQAINWVIAGGESGANARPSNPDWFRALRNQCQEADVPFFSSNGEST
jgi:protein gp37